MVKKSEYFLIRIFQIGRDPCPLAFLTESKKICFFMPLLTGYSCYLICNNSRQLQSTTELNSYSSFSTFLSLSVFVFVLPHVFVIVFVFPVFTMTSMTTSQNCDIADTEPIACQAPYIKMHQGGGGWGLFALSISDPCHCFSFGSYWVVMQVEVRRCFWNIG